MKRRECDDMVSRQFGANRAGTHSPTPERPGKVSSDFSKAMDDAGFKLAVHKAAPSAMQYIEVYPHTALLRLTGDKYRLEYKEAKKSKYWPDATKSERR
jgi:predicted RNase H-like nuclease